jgi:hypothetical protein
MAPASGVIGFPSKKIVLEHLRSGPYTIKLWPTTHPISLDAKWTPP